jgi:hypothetical protein
MPQHSEDSQSEADNGAGSSKYSWGFVTEQGGSSGNMSPFSMSRSASSDPNAANGDGLLPSALMGSALSIDEFDESDSEEPADHHQPGADDLRMELEAPDSATNGRSAPEDGSYPLEGLLYRAAYAFTAEAPQEMSLAEGDLVRVWEQLCDGWVVGG